MTFQRYLQPYYEALLMIKLTRRNFLKGNLNIFLRIIFHLENESTWLISMKFNFDEIFSKPRKKGRNKKKILNFFYFNHSNFSIEKKETISFTDKFKSVFFSPRKFLTRRRLVCVLKKIRGGDDAASIPGKERKVPTSFLTPS